ncbi:MAG: lamin tail domain-containing protein [Bacteroidota bacterium]
MRAILLLLIGSLFIINTARSQCPVDSIRLECLAVETFDDFEGTGFVPDPMSGELCSNRWAITGFSDGDLAFEDSQTSGDYARGVADGTGNSETTGGIYVLDNGTQKALWIQPGTNDFTSGTITYRIQNQSGTTLTDIDISYDILVLNDQNRSNSFNFSYSTDDNTYVEVPDLDYTSIAPENDPASIEVINRMTTIVGLSLADGDFFYLRWTGDDDGGSGSRDEFGLDNISVCAASMDCSITNTTIQNERCDGADFIFEVAFDVQNGSDSYEVVRVSDGQVLASGIASPIEITLANSTSTTAFDIFVRDAIEPTCESDQVTVTPQDCSTPVCAITDVATQNARCENGDFIFEVTFQVQNGSGNYEVINNADNSILASGATSPIAVTLLGNTSTDLLEIFVRDATEMTCQSMTTTVQLEDCNCMQVDARINEFHYDNIGGDINEFVEIFIPNSQPTDLSLYTIELYNGSNGNGYGDITLDQTIVTTDANGSYYVWEPSSLQNGSPDGIALAGPCSLIEFISYEGTFAANDGIAQGETSADVGVEQSSTTTPEQSSIQLIDGTWTLTDAFNTKGAANSLPPCSITNIAIQNGRCVGADFVFEVTFDVQSGSDSYEVIRVSDGQVLASGMASPIEVILVGNTDATPFDIFVRDENEPTCQSSTTTVTPEDCTIPICTISNVAIQNDRCDGTDFVFEVTFDVENGSNDYEVVRVSDGQVLANGTASPIEVTLIGNTSTTPFDIFVRDTNEPTCQSANVTVTPEDCTPLICANVGDLVITEFIANPAAVTDANGEWLEIYNATSAAIDLEGYVLRDDETDSHTISSSVIISTMDYVILGRNADQTTNGGVIVDYEYDDINLNNTTPDQIVLECDGTEIDRVNYNSTDFAIENGASTSLNPDFLNATDNDNGENWCASTSTYGDGDLGTPGEANDACPECMISNIAIEDGRCEDADFVFEVTFDVENGSDSYEVIRVSDGQVLASGTASPIEVTILNSVDETPFDVFVRDANESTCQSEASTVTPFDCSPLICANIGDLVITEFIANPAAVTDANGEWLEIYNATNSSIDIEGYVLRDDNDDAHTIATSVVIPAMDYVILGRNADQITNGGVVVDYEYDDINLNNTTPDQIVLECNGTEIDRVNYNSTDFAIENGASTSLNPDFLNATDNDNGENWCASTSTYGDGDLGTPGEANDACPECMISNIAIEDGRCEEADFVFEVAFDAENGSDSYEVVRVSDNAVLGSGDESPIEVILIENVDTTSFDVFVRDANEPTCVSDTTTASPLDCTPLVCAEIGDLVISEFLVDPVAVSDANGEWIEIYNATDVVINLKGYEINDGDMTPHEIDEDVIVPPTGYVILARNADPNENGGVNADYKYSSINLTNSDGIITLSCMGDIIDEVIYDEATFPIEPGVSTNLNPDFLNATDNDLGENWCESSSVFGDGDLGTPGEANDACPECMISNIAIEDGRCEDADFVFEVTFDVENGSDSYEVIRVSDGQVLASGTASPIEVTILNSVDETPFEVFVRDVNEPTCRSANATVTPEDCTPLVCANVGDLVITEFIANPAAVSDSDGEWIEIYNATDAPIDIEGYILKDDGSNEHEIASSVVVPAMGYVVLGANADQTMNGGVEVDYEYSSFGLTNSEDEIILECDGTEIDRVNYNDDDFPIEAGVSTNLNPDFLNALDNDSGENWCEATSAYGDGDLGTPGEANDACPLPLMCAESGDLVISEFLADPDTVSDANGEWIEIYNSTNDSINLKGYFLNDKAGTAEEITEDVIVPPMGYVILARNADPTENGGVDADYEYSTSINLTNSEDQILLLCMGDTIDLVVYDDETFSVLLGISTSLNPDFLNATDNDDGTNWCGANRPFGDGDLGTPGEANNECPKCEIRNLMVENAGCDGMDFVFSLSFEDTLSSGQFEVVNVANEMILGTGDASPIEVRLTDNRDNTEIEIFLRDANDSACVSDTVLIDLQNCVDVCDLDLIDIETEAPLCLGNDNGSILVNVSSTLPIQYSIDGGATFQTEPLFENLLADTYEIVITTDVLDDCEIRTTATIDEGEEIELDEIVVQNEICPDANDGSIFIDADLEDANLLYSIDGGTTFQNEPLFENLSPRTYEIVVQAAEDDFCTTNFGAVTIEEGVDNEAPTFTCPTNISQGTDEGVCGATVSNLMLQNVTDNCDPNPIIEYTISGVTTASGSGNLNSFFFNQGESIVTYTVTDINGNAATCSFTVTIFDDDAPTTDNCPEDIVINNATAFYLDGGEVTWTPPTFIDNCTDEADIQIDNNIAPRITPHLGVTDINYTAIDEAGNNSLCEFDIVLRDIYIIDPCNCTDSGQFTETIRVFSRSGEMWQIVAVENLLQPNGTSYQIGDQLIESEVGEYDLEVLFNREKTYSITVSNGETTLTTSNSCNEAVACRGDIAIPNDGGAPKLYNIACGDNIGFFDDGGAAKPYFDQTAQTDILILCAENPATQSLVIEFDRFDLPEGEFLSVFDGKNAAAPILANRVNGTSVADAPGGGWVQAACENTSGCLTIVFERNGDNRKGAGWDAHIRCEARDSRFICTDDQLFTQISDRCGQIPETRLPLPDIIECGEEIFPRVTIDCENVAFEIDSSNRELVILDAPIGEYEIEFVHPIFEELNCSSTLRILPPTLACNDLIRVSSATDCAITLTPDLFLEGSCVTQIVDYDIILDDPNIPILSITDDGFPIIDVSSFACDTRFTVRINRSITNDCGDIYEDACWSEVIFEDKVAPILSGGIDNDTVYCYQNIDLLPKLQQIDAEGGQLELPFGDILVIEAIDNQFVATDNCKANIEVGEWQFVAYDCTDNTAHDILDLHDIFDLENGVEAIFGLYFRTVLAVDKCGNTSDFGLQRILVTQPDIVAPQLEIALPCGVSPEPKNLYQLWLDGEEEYATYIPNYDPTPAELNGDFGGFANLDDTYLTDNSGDEIPADLSHEICGYAIDWEDSDDIPVCGESYKIFREWTVYNWCDGHLELIDLIPQVIQVGKADAPKLTLLSSQTVNTTSDECRADVLFQIDLQTDCNNTFTAYSDVLNDGQFEQIADLQNGELRISDLPIGDSIQFTIRLIDECQNEATFGPFNIFVEDDVPPIAVCESVRQVSLGVGCEAIVPAMAFDDGSYDGCGTLSLSVAKAEDVLIDGNISTEFFENIDTTLFEETLRITSSDLETGKCESSLMVVLRVADISGNLNYCMVEAQLKDQFPPVCVSRNDTISCLSPDWDDLRRILNLEGAEQRDSLASQLSAGLFGGIQVEDACGATTFIVSNVNARGYDASCKSGTITYQYQATDACGNASVICENSITVTPVNAWQMDFPRDREISCDTRFIDFRIEREIADLEDILVSNEGCDDWRMEVEIERFEKAEEACYQLVVSYHFVNWCTWNPNNTEIAIVERPDSLLDERFETMSLRYQDLYINDDEFVECGVQRDLDDCEIILSPLGMDGINDIDDFCDDGDDSFTNLNLGCDGDFVQFEFGEKPSGIDTFQFRSAIDTGSVKTYVSAQAYGNFIYRQYINVFDITAPEIEIETLEEVYCGGDAEADDLCTANVVVEFSVDDPCVEPENLGVSYELLLFGETAVEDVFGELEYLGDDRYRISGDYPIQAGGDTTAHAFLLRVEDECFNVTEQRIDFQVVDCKAPTVKCIFGLSGTLHEDGRYQMQVSDFDKGSFDFCTNADELRFTFADPSIYPDSTVRTFDCRNGELGMVKVFLWVQDLAGNAAFCETFVSLVPQENNPCPDNSDAASLSGIVTNTSRQPIREVEIQLSGDAQATYTTGEDGTYVFSNVGVDSDYSISPQKSSDYLAGVSTYDLILISKHILGQEQLDSPYKIIAADANRSGSVTTFDIVLLRKLLLGKEEAFPDGASWRFVAADYEFADISRPLDEDFLEVIDVNDIINQLSNLNFIAVKLGDVNESYNNANIVETRSLPTHNFDVEITILEDNVHRLSFQTDHAQIEGYQFTLAYDENELMIEKWENGVVGVGEWAMPKAGKLTCSWNGEAADNEAFSLLVRKASDSDWNDILQFNSDVTAAEVYLKNGDLARPKLNIKATETTAAIQFYPVSPNPFDKETLIAFDLPKSQTAILRLRDVHGKLVFEYDAIFEQGRNEVLLERKDLASGVYYLTLVVGEQQLSQKVLVQ